MKTVNKAVSAFKDKNETYKCNKCVKNFHRKASLAVHINTHSFNNNIREEKAETESQNTCKVCQKKFTAKKNLLKHLRDIHKNYGEAERMVVKKIKCPERNCEFLCRMMKELRDHIENCHNIKILKDTLQFSSEKVFQKWKTEEEANTVSWFVTGRRRSTLTDGTKKQTLHCHRTGHYSPKGFGKYRMRSNGSCKIGVTCPATMEVTESPDGKVTVIYYKTHLGHMQDVVYLKLSREERLNLAEKIKQGFSFDAILEDVKESHNLNHDKKKRIHLLSKKDLYSIKRTEKCFSTKPNINDENINESVKTKNSELSQGISLMEENIKIEKTDENIHQSLSMYSYQSVIPSHDSKTEFHLNPNFMSYQRSQRNILNPQISAEGATSQILIIPPDIAEVILLAAEQGAPAQQTVSSQNKVPVIENCSVAKTDSGTQTVHEQFVENENEIIKSNFQSQLRDKLGQISKLLPQTECLTPKQFDLVTAKMNGILDILNVANVKGNARKQNLRKKVVRKNNKPKGKMVCETKYKVQEDVLGQQFYDSMLLYAVYN